MSRVTDNEMALEYISEVVHQVNRSDLERLAIVVPGILSDISKSLAVIADALAKNQEDKV